MRRRVVISEWCPGSVTTQCMHLRVNVAWYIDHFNTSVQAAWDSHPYKYLMLLLNVLWQSASFEVFQLTVLQFNSPMLLVGGCCSKLYCWIKQFVLDERLNPISLNSGITEQAVMDTGCVCVIVCAQCQSDNSFLCFNPSGTVIRSEEK